MQQRTHIILTRQPEQAGPLESELQTARVHVSALPLIDFAVPADTSTLETSLQKLAQGRFDWVVLTSPNTVRALAANHFFDSDLSGDGAELPVRWAMVGGGTAHLFQQLSGLEPDLVATKEQSGAGLVAEFPPTPTAPASSTSRVLLPVSNLASNTVERGLRGAGYEVHRVTAYLNVTGGISPGQQRLLDSPADTQVDTITVEQLANKVAAVTAVVLTSPSNVRAFMAESEDYPALKLLTLIAIGNPTAAALTQYGLQADAVLQHPNAQSVLQWLKDTDQLEHS